MANRGGTGDSVKRWQEWLEKSGRYDKNVRDARVRADRAHDSARKAKTKTAAQTSVNQMKEDWDEAGNIVSAAQAALTHAKAPTASVAGGQTTATFAATESDLSGKALEQLLESARTIANIAREARRNAESARDKARKAITKEAAQKSATEAQASAGTAVQQWIDAESEAARAGFVAKVAGALAENEEEAALAAAARAAVTAAAKDMNDAEQAAYAAQQIADTA